jgi:TolB-like protein
MTDRIDDQRDMDTARPKVFLSYTRAELDNAKTVIALLEDAGFDVWWDGLLEGGVNYLATTEAALENANCVVVLWSKLSVDSNWVRDEAQRGRERGCLVPLSIDGTMAPLGFRQFQLIDVSSWNGDPKSADAAKIVNAVSLRAQATGGAPAQAATPQPRAQGTSPSPLVSRRAAIIGGVGLVGGAAVLGGWQMGMFNAGGDGVMPLAVLRFANLTGDDEQGWFSLGLSNELRKTLARNPRLRVSAPSSSTAVEGEDDFSIGQALGVRQILRGSVQRAAETIRISVELVQISDGLVRWSESYDRSFVDIFAVQTEIAETVALALVTEIAGNSEAQRSLKEQQDVGGTDNVRAYEAYLRGIAFFELSAGADSDRSALAQFDAAIAADPDYAAAYAMRASMLAAIANTTSDAAEVGAFYDRSIAAARRSIELEADLARGHLALGFGYSNGKLNRSEAYSHYRRAQELAPGDADILRSVAIFYAYGDQQALATRMIDKVLLLDPINAIAFRAAGYVALLSREYRTVIARMERSLELNPKLASAHYAIGNARYMQADYSGALASFEAEPVQIFRLTGAAITQAKLGNPDAARAAFASVIAEYGNASLYQQAQILGQWGDIEQALEVLARAFAESDPGVLFAPNDPLLDPLRGEPKLDRLLLQLSS